MSLSLIPEVLDAVDVILVFYDKLGVIDPHMMEIRHIEDIINPEAIRVDNAVGYCFAFKDG